MERIVVFTNKSARGAAILRHMKRRNIPIAAIVIDTTKWSRNKKGKKLKRTMSRVGIRATLQFVLKRIKKTVVPKKQKAWQSNDFYRNYSNAVYTVNNFNDAQSEHLMKEVEPDLIILGGARIIRKNIIAIPKIGILNAHPGLLPKYRGVDVIPWAIHNGDPVGVTVHFIDEGIDTGGIVGQKIVEMEQGDTFGSLMKKANDIAGKLVCDAVMAFLETGHIPVQPQTKESGKQYYRMPVKLHQETAQKLNHFTQNLEQSMFCQ